MTKREKLWRSFKSDIASGVRSMAEALQAADLIRDPGSLHRAASKCDAYHQEGLWGYTLEGFEMSASDSHISKYRNYIPNTIIELSFTLNISIEGRYVEELGTEDPINALNVECVIEGMNEDSLSSCAWHLDRIIGTPETESKHFVHPVYHFQFGGNKQPTNIGELLFVEPPRLAHPPLDAILAIDFILSNYFPISWQNIRQNNEHYRRSVQKSQHYFWKPYATQLGANWTPSDNEWNAVDIWPHLIKGSLYT